MKKLIVICFLISIGSCKNVSKGEIMDFINAYEKKVVDLSRESNETYFKATISGSKSDYEKYSELEIKLNDVYSNSNDFNTVKDYLESDIEDPILKRQVQLIYNKFKAKQVSK
jgi:hypothetical protein